VHAWPTYVGSETSAAVAVDALVGKHYADHKRQIDKIAQMEMGTQGDGIWKSLELGDPWTELVGPAATVQDIVDLGNSRRVFAATP
jgi:hypothetical protein